ncbi:hypothetical protein T08_13142 [Trichinella sp. T8]|nr:hypothetical protein T08_13142 [Trichinella sp. T8]
MNNVEENFVGSLRVFWFHVVCRKYPITRKMSCCSLVNTNHSRSFEKVPLLNYRMEILHDFDFTRSFSGWFDSAGYSLALLRTC